MESWMKNILGIKYLINLLNKWASVASCKAPIAAACQLWMDMSSNFGTVFSNFFWQHFVVFCHPLPLVNHHTCFY